MKSFVTTLAVLAAALVLMTAVDAGNMDKYYKRTGAKFLAEKASEPDVHKLPSGLLYKAGASAVNTWGPSLSSTTKGAAFPRVDPPEMKCMLPKRAVGSHHGEVPWRWVLKSSDKKNPKSPTEGDQCEVTYAGRLRDGTPFDSGTTSFSPNQVIKGWTEAMQLMCEGDKWELYIPYDLAYGEYGSPPRIPPFSPLVFEIEIHKVKSGGKSCDAAKELITKKLTEAKEL